MSLKPRARLGARPARQGGVVLMELLIEFMVMAWLAVWAVEVLSLWTERQVSERAAEGANDIMVAVRTFYLAGDVETERWPADPWGADTRIDTLINGGFLRDDINPHPYGGQYALNLVNSDRVLTLTFTVDDPGMARYIALNIPEHGRAADTTVTASMPRPNVHRDHDELLPLDGSRPLTGTLDVDGHALTGLREFLRVDDPAKALITNLDHPEDVAYFPDDNDMGVAFANTASIIGRWPSDEGNRWLVTNISTDTTRNHLIPLRTEAEWLSFKDNLVPRTAELEVCEILDEDNLSCTAAHTHVPPWTPDTSTVCSGTTFTQAAACGHTRSAAGTKYCAPAHTHIRPWSPPKREVCDGVYFTQTAQCGHTREKRGRKKCDTTPPPHTHISPWSPATNTVCIGTRFTQTAACGHTRSATGTKSCSVTPPDPCEAPEVTKWKSTVIYWYDKVFNRSDPDAAGLCYWSTEMAEGDFTEEAFVWGARGGNCSARTGDCWHGSQYIPLGKTKAYYSCETCLGLVASANAFCSSQHQFGSQWESCALNEGRRLFRAARTVDEKITEECRRGDEYCERDKKGEWSGIMQRFGQVARQRCAERGYTLATNGDCVREEVDTQLNVYGVHRTKALKEECGPLLGARQVRCINRFVQLYTKDQIREERRKK